MRIENRTRVVTPTGHVARVDITRRQRALIAAGKLNTVAVVCPDGARRLYPLDELKVYERPRACCVCGTTEGLRYEGSWHGWRCADPECCMF